MLHICLSFDYELFFGDNYFSEDEILFKPTDKLIDILKESDVTSTFFVDVCSVYQYEKFGLHEYPKAFKNQLVKMIRYGQDIQLHIHPHWFKTNHKENKWLFDADSYKIHYFGFEEQQEMSAKKIIEKGKAFLLDTLRPYDTNYKCIAFRAGGFCIQPEQQLFEALIQNEIIIDSSIAPRLIARNTVNNYNFSRVPNRLNWWVNPPYRINQDSDVKTQKSIYEVPIATIRSNFIKMLFTPMSKLKIPNHESKGSFINSQEEQRSKLISYIRTIARRAFGYNILSLDTRSYHLLNENLNSLYEKYNCNKNDCYISIICHPKLISEDSLINLINFINIIKSQEDRFRFVNMMDIYNTVIRDQS